MLILKEKILVYTITIYHIWDIREQAPGSYSLDIQNPQKAGCPSAIPALLQGHGVKRNPRTLWATWPGRHSDEQERPGLRQGRGGWTAKVVLRPPHTHSSVSISAYTPHTYSMHTW